ncbi:MAG TPA: TRAP transporter TatT component family protein [Pseudomonadota bacterium]|jgi:predicted anti-sigma-YlaC factor YlaD|nr:TRAP transporter TatT component family protein [Pseudomonadota bacterium]HNF96893.1 TRAP transporter TatT component family protein [Pseudomonadota bacterium]HNI59407.1 TRAP transporter TatT component family protein [Pseudomonadota bacterium]HNK45568.1 TRAP transporter TatT component family protein [Pseudomonadota bacterium]HNN53554.1 TRAP transporter TatT component family protein [Pseudomonadota bacterium]
MHAGFRDGGGDVRRRQHWLILPTLLAVLSSGCSIKGYALKATADALSSTGGGYGTEDDPDLVKQSAPFGLKTMETLAESLPQHRPIRLALASGFVQYAYAFVNQDADRIADKSIAQAKKEWMRARRLYLRGRNYGLDALELAYPGFRKSLLSGNAGEAKAALQRVGKDDVPYLYWVGAGWALAISTGKDDPQLFGDFGLVGQLMERALELDESFDEGSIHEFFVSYDSSRSEDQGGGPAQAKKHLDIAQKQGGGKKLGSLLSYAEGILLQQQKKAEFVKLLEQIVAADVYSEDPTWKKNRLANIIAQERSRWLLGKLSDLFAD